MNHDFILSKVIETYAYCDFKKFPFDCFKAIKMYGYRIFTYSELKEKSPEAYELCVACSDESYKDPFSKTVAFNEHMPTDRITFSMAHELGHIVLDHPCKTDYYEAEANCFASYLLAPRMAIHYCRCKNSWEVEHHFGISSDAADCAFDDYQEWRRRATHKMYPIDWIVYQYFYHPEFKRFICGENQCLYCGRTFYNHPGDCICPICYAKVNQEPYGLSNLILSKKRIGKAMTAC